MRKLFLAFLLLLLFSVAYSASINASDSIAANAVWSFSVSLPNASEFDNAEVLLDGSSLGIKWYAPGDTILVDEKNIDKTRVFSSSQPVSNTIYFMITPMLKGTHSIVLNVDSSESARKEIRFFEALDSAQQANLQTELSGLRGTVIALEERLNALQADSLKKEDKDQLLAEINSLKGKIDSMQSSLDSFAADESQNKESIDGLVAETQALRQQTTKLNESMESGFFGLGKSWQGIGLIAALLIVAIIVIAVAYSKRHLFHFKRSLYGKRMGPGDLGATLSEEDGGIAAAGLAAEARPGKWAVEKPVEEKRHRFHFGDLIKK